MSLQRRHSSSLYAHSLFGLLIVFENASYGGANSADPFAICDGITENTKDLPSLGMAWFITTTNQRCLKKCCPLRNVDIPAKGSYEKKFPVSISLVSFRS